MLSWCIFMSVEDDPIVALLVLDGTLADHMGELQRRLELIRSPGEPKIDPTAFGWVEQPAYFRERIRLIRGNPGFWINLPVLAGDFEILEEAHRLGFRIEV